MRVGSDCASFPRGATAAEAKRSGEALEVAVNGRVVRFAGDTVSVK
jgi:hypothetical protein